MWSRENRERYDRSHLRYESDLSDEEWAEVGPLIPPAKPGGNKRSVDIREVVNGVMYILSTGCQWRAIPKDLPPRSTVHDYLDRSPDQLSEEEVRGYLLGLRQRGARGTFKTSHYGLRFFYHHTLGQAWGLFGEKKDRLTTTEAAA